MKECQKCSWLKRRWHAFAQNMLGIGVWFRKRAEWLQPTIKQRYPIVIVSDISVALTNKIEKMGWIMITIKILLAALMRMSLQCFI